MGEKAATATAAVAGAELIMVPIYIVAVAMLTTQQQCLSLQDRRLDILVVVNDSLIRFISSRHVFLFLLLWGYFFSFNSA